MAETNTLITEEDIQKQRDLVSKLEADMQNLQMRVPETKEQIDSLTKKIEELKTTLSQQDAQSAEKISEKVQVFVPDSEYERFKKEYEMVEDDADLLVRLRQAELDSLDGPNPELDKLQKELAEKRQYNQRHLDWLKMQMDNHSKMVEMSQVERIIARYETEHSAQDEAFLNSLSDDFANLPDDTINAEEENSRRQFEDDIKELKAERQSLADQMKQLRDEYYETVKDESEKLSQKIKELADQIEDAIHAPNQVILLSKEIQEKQKQWATLIAKQAELKDHDSFQYHDTNNEINNIESQLESLNQRLSYYKSLDKDALVKEREAAIQEREKLNYTPSEEYLILQERYQSVADELNQKFQKRAKNTKGNRLERLRKEENKILGDLVQISQTLKTVSGEEKSNVLEQLRSKNAELEKTRSAIAQLNNPETLENLTARQQSLENQINQIKSKMSGIGISDEDRIKYSKELNAISDEKSKVDARISAIKNLTVKKNPIQMYRELRKRVEQAREDADFMYPSFYAEEQLLHRIEEKAFLYFTNQTAKKSVSNSNVADVKKLEEQLQQLQQEHSQLIGDFNLAKSKYDDAKEKLDKMITQKDASSQDKSESRTLEDSPQPPEKPNDESKKPEETQPSRKRWECKAISVTPGRLQTLLFGSKTIKPVFQKAYDKMNWRAKWKVNRLNKAQVSLDKAEADYAYQKKQFDQICAEEDALKQLIEKQVEIATLNKTLTNMKNNTSKQGVELLKMCNNACDLLHLPRIEKLDTHQIPSILQQLSRQQDKLSKQYYFELAEGSRQYNKGIIVQKKREEELSATQASIQENLSKLGIPLNASVDEINDRYKKLLEEKKNWASQLKKAERKVEFAKVNLDDLKSDKMVLVDGDPTKMYAYTHSGYRKEHNSGKRVKEAASRVFQYAKPATEESTKEEPVADQSLDAEETKKAISRVFQYAKPSTEEPAKEEPVAEQSLDAEEINKDGSHLFSDVQPATEESMQVEPAVEKDAESFDVHISLPSSPQKVIVTPPLDSRSFELPSVTHEKQDSDGSTVDIDKELDDAIAGSAAALDEANKRLVESEQMPTYQVSQENLRKKVANIDSLSTDELAQLASAAGAMSGPAVEPAVTQPSLGK